MRNYIKKNVAGGTAKTKKTVINGETGGGKSIATTGKPSEAFYDGTSKVPGNKIFKPTK